MKHRKKMRENAIKMERKQRENIHVGKMKIL
jgi:hypothetical protein